MAVRKKVNGNGKVHSNGSGGSVAAAVAESEAPAPLSLDDPRLYVNRELSLLAFQQRVLEEAQDPSNPLLERIKFLSIVGSNLDEFFMVRVAALQEQVEAGILEVGPDGLTPARQLSAIRHDVLDLLSKAHKGFREHLVPGLRAAGIQIADYNSITEKQRAHVDQYFHALNLGN